MMMAITMKDTIALVKLGNHRSIDWVAKMVMIGGEGGI